MRVWGSAGRAAEVLTQCRSWPRVEQQICFTLPEADATEAALIIERGARFLRHIPGVREVVSSVVQSEGHAVRYCWQLRLSSDAVVERLHADAEFQAFSKRYLEGYAQQNERVTLLEQSSFAAGV
jgi:fructose-bisphosphate aldolase class II